MSRVRTASGGRCFLAGRHFSVGLGLLLCLSVSPTPAWADLVGVDINTPERLNATAIEISWEEEVPDADFYAIVCAWDYFGPYYFVGSTEAQSYVHDPELASCHMFFYAVVAVVETDEFDPYQGYVFNGDPEEDEDWPFGWPQYALPSDEPEAAFNKGGGAIDEPP
jgi:hypothetical protein